MELAQEARHLRKGEEMKKNPIAFDDRELRNWLIDLIADGSQEFLSALAEAVLSADAEDYDVIRPVLLDLKRKYPMGPGNGVPAGHCHGARHAGYNSKRKMADTVNDIPLVRNSARFFANFANSRTR